jgi:hypothetical protein
MTTKSFFCASTLFRELGEPAGAPPGGAPGPAGGPPGSDPMGGMGAPPGMGGGMGAPPGGDPMGGGQQQQQPIEIKSIPAADVWKLLEKIVKDTNKYGKFFDEINITKQQDQQVVYSKKPDNKKTSLQK